MRAFQEGLQRAGWSIGIDLLMDIRWGVGDINWIGSTVTDTMQLAPEVILAISDQVAQVVKSASQTIPVVFIGTSDQIAEGFVQSLAHPNGNMTGFTVQEPRLGPKWISLLPDHSSVLQGRVAFAWRVMDAFYEEDERIVGHAADAYQRIDIRQSSRHLVVKLDDRVIADTTRPVVLFESGFAPRWYVPREDIDENALTPAEDKRSAPIRAWPAITTSAAARRRRGPIRGPGPSLHGSPTSSRSSRTRSMSSWTTRNSPSRRVRASCRTESTEAWILTKC
jgi:hypothetical protein